MLLTWQAIQIELHHHGNYLMYNKMNVQRIAVHYKYLFSTVVLN